MYSSDVVDKEVGFAQETIQCIHQAANFNIWNILTELRFSLTLTTLALFITKLADNVQHACTWL